MRIFVTGGTGFIGSAVVRDLVAAGHDVVCLVRPHSHRERLAAFPIDFIVGDVCAVESFAGAMRRCDAAIHLAAPGGWTRDDPRLLERVIEGGTASVLAIAEGVPGLRLVVVSSTAAVNASDRPCVFDERSPFTISDPTLSYAHAKHRAELLACESCARGGDVVIVNPAEVYGPNDWSLGTAGNLVDIARARPVLVCEGGTGIVHVDDVAAGIVRALECGRSGERYILSGENFTIRGLAELVLDLLGRRAHIVSVPNGLARAAARVAGGLRLPAPFNPAVVPYATRFWFVDNTKARRELGSSFRDARATVASALEWLRSRALV